MRSLLARMQFGFVHSCCLHVFEILSHNVSAERRFWMTQANDRQGNPQPEGAGPIACAARLQSPQKGVIPWKHHHSRMKPIHKESIQYITLIPFPRKRCIIHV